MDTVRAAFDRDILISHVYICYVGNLGRVFCNTPSSYFVKATWHVISKFKIIPQDCMDVFAGDGIFRWKSMICAIVISQSSYFATVPIKVVTYSL